MFPVGDPTDVTGKRLGAWLIDGVIYVVLSNVLTAVLGLGSFATRQITDLGNIPPETFCASWRAANDGICIASEDSVLLVDDPYGGLVVFAGLFILFCVVQGVLGGSLGKLAVGLRIVKRDGSQAGIGASFARTLMWIVDAIPCIPLVGLITMSTSKGHRRVGDMVAGTFVVPASHVGQPVILPGEPGYGRIPTGQAPWGGAPGTTTHGTPPAGYDITGLPPATFGPGTSSEPQYEADTPSWDAARNTYIKYDSTRAAWLELDQATNQWVPIST